MSGKRKQTKTARSEASISPPQAEGDGEKKSKKGFDIWHLLLGNKEKRAQYNGGLQIIGAGFGRTGTTSLKKAFEILYDNAPCYHMSAVIENDYVSFWASMDAGTATDEDITLQNTRPPRTIRLVCTGNDYCRSFLRPRWSCRCGMPKAGPRAFSTRWAISNQAIQTCRLVCGSFNTHSLFGLGGVA